ncbi:hypothetical protein Q9L58_003989 [Maublancomyces gigas]|uniref:Uncharacterized protein n=1 Tax=Discina gigas TaxID=1032678 RepID=A0ABR3GM73_9PEZI
MKYSIALSSLLLTLALAAPHPQNSYTSPGPTTLICETSAASPAVSDVQNLADHFKTATNTCFHNLGTGPDHCEVLYHNKKAALGVCGPVSLYQCHAAYDMLTQLLGLEGCIQTHAGVKRIGGKALLTWGTLNVYSMNSKSAQLPVEDEDNILGPGAKLVLDTSEP